MELSAIAPEESSTTLIVSWRIPANFSGVVSQYYVIVTNYSNTSVADRSVPGDVTSTMVTDLGKYSNACLYQSILRDFYA